MQGTDQDFKYVIQDFSNVYLGGRLTYEELVEADDAPLQLKQIVHRVIKKEVPITTVIQEHLLSLSEDSESFLMFKQLKIKVEVVFSVLVKKGLREKEEYKSQTYTLEELMHAEELHGEKRNFLIREVRFKKLRLATVSV